MQTRAATAPGEESPSAQAPAGETGAAPDELATMQALEVARANYTVRLEALQERATLSGDLQKRIWAGKELANLKNAEGVEWTGPGPVKRPDRATLRSVNEATLVEMVVAARGQYLAAVDNLLAIYQARQDMEKAEVIQGMADRFNPVHTYMYYMEAEIPSGDLRASERISAADNAFDAALKTFEDSKSVFRTPSDSDRKRFEALDAMRKIVYNYPSSSQIGCCAYYIAEVHRKYDDDIRAAAWYLRALEWDPKIDLPVRYRLGTLYDYKLNDADNALKYYRLSVQVETRNRQNIEHARQRIALLKERAE